MQRIRVGIIGTGMTALSIGYYLPLVVPEVQIVFFDKASKVGGRLATRRSRENKQVLFDHGAPYLYKDQLKEDFQNVLQRLNAIQQVKLNHVKPQSIKQSKSSQIKTSNVFIGPDGFDSITSALKKNLKNVDQFVFDSRVTQIIPNQKNQLSLKYQQSPKSPKWNQIAPFHRVFCCIPFPQAQQIKQNIFSFEPFKQVKSAYHAKWIVLVTVKKGRLFSTYKDTDVIDFSVIKDSPIKYAVKQNKKFKALENSDNQNWVIYFSEQWTESNLKLSKQQVEQKFIKEIIGQYLTEESSQSLKPQFLKAHRWLYSGPKEENKLEKPLVSQDKRLIFAGDWVGNRQNVGECWQLGRQIIEQIYGVKDLQTKMSKSKL